MAFLYDTRTGLRRVQGTGPGQVQGLRSIGTRSCTEIFILVHHRERNQDLLFPIVLVPLSCSVTKPLHATILVFFKIFVGHESFLWGH